MVERTNDTYESLKKSFNPEDLGEVFIKDTGLLFYIQVYYGGGPKRPLAELKTYLNINLKGGVKDKRI